MRPENAGLLFDFVKKHPVKKILDLGTGIGCSVAIIALALKTKGEEDFKMDSVEQYDKCIKLANELIPEELKKNVTIHKSNAVLWQTDKIPYQHFSIYDSLPDGDYDLILNDGPGPWAENGNYIDLSNGTIIKLLLENRLKPNTLIAFDGRFVALKTIERYFSENFYLFQPAPNGTSLNIIQRKDNLVKFEDEEMKYMTEFGYFKGM